MTPELFSDRGIAWVKSVFEVCNQAVANFGLLTLAAIGVWQNIMSKAEVKEAVQNVKDRLDRQGEKIEATSQAVTAVALSVPPPITSDSPLPVEVTNQVSNPVPVTEPKP